MDSTKDLHSLESALSISTGQMDEVDGRVTKRQIDEVSNAPSTVSSSGRWKWCGESLPRGQIVFFTQMTLALTVIVASIVCLALERDNKEFWMVMLSGCMGYIMPNPNMKIPQSKTTYTAASHNREQLT